MYTYINYISVFVIQNVGIISIEYQDKNLLETDTQFSSKYAFALIDAILSRKQQPSWHNLLA